MDVTVATDVISVVGFPIACAIAMGYFIFTIYKRSIVREDKLYDELSNCREVNKQAIETITRYADRLDNISYDVSEMKTDIAKINEKIN